jgi:hypothetical protein
MSYMKPLKQGVKKWRQFFARVCHQQLSLPLVLLGVVAGFSFSSSAQNQEVSAQFPDPKQVTADFPDDAERYAAFLFLDITLNADAPQPVSKATYDKLFNYEAAYNQIEGRHRLVSPQSEDYKFWITQRDKMTDDHEFARSVLEKYQLTGLKAIPRPPPPDYVQTPSAYAPAPIQTSYPDSPGDRLNRLCVRALPVVAISLAGMIWLPWLMLGRAGIKSRFSKPPVLEPNANLSPLPESLRVIQLPGVRYYVKTFSGLLLGKDTAIYTSSYTETTPDRIETIGGMEKRTPGQTTTTRTSRRVDTLRVRTPDGREATWTLTGNSGDRIFIGQTITCIARPVKADFSEFVLVYNHNTGEFVRVEEGLTNAHRPGGFLGWLAQPLSTLIGSVGFAILVAYFLTSGIGNLINVGGVDFFIGLWVVGGFCALTVVFFTMHLLKYKITQRRNARLLSQYGPQFRQYFAQITPSLKQRLGGQ